jgi:nicotinate-nucleotide adenylyltransferase
MPSSGHSLIGIFGGTFDPIHYGHLRIAEEVAEMIDVQKMHFIPAGYPRLRCSPEASLQHRAAMVGLAIEGNPRFILDEREIRRPGVSYSVESLRELKQELGEDATLCFVTGADAFMNLASWHRWRELFELCHFIIAARPGHVLTENLDMLPQELSAECTRRWVSSVDSLRHATSGMIFIAQTTLLDISATVIRARVAAGKSIRYLIPDVALDYIAVNHLYSEKG